MTYWRNYSGEVDAFEKMLADIIQRLDRAEARRIKPYRNIAVAAVADQAHLPDEPEAGDIALAVDTGQVYTADASRTWVATGTLP